MVQTYFIKFPNGDFNLSDEERLSWFAEIDNDQISALIQINPLYAIREIAKKLKISKCSVQCYLHELGLISRYDLDSA